MKTTKDNSSLIHRQMQYYNTTAETCKCGETALLKPATLKCMYGGTISIVDPGQTLEIKK